VKQPSKHQRRFEEGAAAAPPPSLDSVNDDCQMLILSHLPTEHLSNVAVCSRRFREARAHESLDQTRTGTIVCREGSTVDGLFNTIAENEWNAVF